MDIDSDLLADSPFLSKLSDAVPTSSSREDRRPIRPFLATPSLFGVPLAGVGVYADLNIPGEVGGRDSGT